MEIKKSEKADLQGKKLIFTQIGLVLSLLIVWGTFNISQGTITIQEVEKPVEEIISELPPVTRPEEQERPQAKLLKVVAPTISDIIEVVDNSIELENEDIFNPEADEDLKVYTGLPTGTPNDGELILEEDVPVIKAEVNPDFRGAGAKSQDEYRKWVQATVKYPSLAQENGVVGAVVLKFVIGKDGRVGDITVLSSPDRSLSDEVTRVLKSSPAWTPGKQRDKPVSVYGTIRIVFQI